MEWVNGSGFQTHSSKRVVTMKKQTHNYKYRFRVSKNNIQHYMEKKYQCNYCKNPISDSNEFCPNCQYPIKGTDKEKSIFIGQQILKKDDLKMAKWFRFLSSFVLIGIGIWILVSFFSEMSNPNAASDLIMTGLIIGSILILLGLLTSKIPILSLSAGIFLILIMDFFTILSNWPDWSKGIYDPMGIWKLALYEIIKIGLLVFSIVKTVEERKILKDHNNLNA